MPASQTPTDVNESSPQPQPGESAPVQFEPIETDIRADAPSAPESDDSTSEGPKTVRGSRWVDFDTHELMQMISELEDERRWARLREGIWIAVLVHLFMLSAVTWIPRYVFKVPRVIDPIDAIKNRKDLSYLDLPPDALRNIQPKPKIKPTQPKVTLDKKTLEAIKKATPPAPQPPQPEPTPPAAVQPKPEIAAAPTPTPPIPPKPETQAQVEAPRPSAVPARPNFAMNSENPAEALREEMRNSSRNAGASNEGSFSGSGMAKHPGAGGGVEVLSDTQGVDFRNWLQRWHRETEITWDPLIPDEVNPPILKSGAVAIRFKVLPNGRLMDGSLQLEGRSGDTALDRAAWGALTGSNYPPLPHDFKGPYLELRAYFLYNMQPGK